jgi:hypothetical protein
LTVAENLINMSKFDLAVILWLPQQLSGLDFDEGSVDK